MYVDVLSRLERDVKMLCQTIKAVHGEGRAWRQADQLLYTVTELRKTAQEEADNARR